MKDILCKKKENAKKLAEVTKIFYELRHSVKHCEYLEHNSHKTLFLFSSFLFSRLFYFTRADKKKRIYLWMVYVNICLTHENHYEQIFSSFSWSNLFIEHKRVFMTASMRKECQDS